MASTLSIEWKPPRILDEVPTDYLGPIYYRQITIVGPPGPKFFGEMIKFEPRKIGKIDVAQRMAAMGTLLEGRRNYPEMFNYEGKLKPEWAEPLKARKKRHFPKQWDDLSPGFLQFISSRVRNIIDEIEPGRHLFLPVEIEPADDEPGTVFIFKSGNGGHGFRALDKEYNPTGSFISDISSWQRPTEFVLLDQQKVEGWHWFDCEIGTVRSQTLIETLGDVLPEKVLLVPMGTRV